MAIEHLTKHHPEPDAVQAVLEIDRCITQARAITRLMGAAGPHEAMPPETLQNAAWTVCDLLKRIDEATGRLGRIASAREA
jgi:hypothetical protein